jgi:hypothetical protein
VNWILYSYSEISVPLLPFKDSYIIGIVEDSQGQRQMTQIDNKYRYILRIGLRGDITRKKIENGEINYFVPSGHGELDV